MQTPDFFSQLVKSFHISILPNNDVDVVVSFVNGMNEQRLIHRDDFLMCSRGTRNQNELYENILNRFFPRYRNMCNQLRERIHDDQVHALSQVVGIPSSFEVRPLEEVTGYDERFTVPDRAEITYTRTTSAEDGVPTEVNISPDGTTMYVTGGSMSSTYGGCQECSRFSSCFGGAPYEGKVIKTEEDFEIIKEQFVAHVNDKHKDLIAKKRSVKHVNKKFKKVKDESFILTSTPHTHNPFYHEYNCTFTMHDEANIHEYYLPDGNIELATHVSSRPVVSEPTTHTPTERRGFRTRISNR